MASRDSSGKLGFNANPTSWMFVSRFNQGSGWDEGRLVPYGHISLSPAACVLNYGQSLFEGLKAYRGQDGDTHIFRPEANAERMRLGAERICMPPYPADDFVEAVEAVVEANDKHIPAYREGALYVRPCLWATGETLAIRPPSSFTFLVYCSPVDNYYDCGLKPLRILVSEDVHRAMPHGTGHVKYSGNYASVMQVEGQALAQGYNAVLYLDSQQGKYVEEVGSANFFCVKDGCLYTPKSDSILPGVIRQSIIQLAEKRLGIPAREVELTIDNALAADECFCSGTAAVISAIGSITRRDEEVVFNGGEVGPVTQRLYDLLTGIQYGEIPSPFLRQTERA